MAVHIRRRQNAADTTPDTSDTSDTSGPSGPPDTGNRRRRDVIAREKERYGGVKVGAAFFGWLAATGAAVLLTAILAAAGAAVSLATGTDLEQAADEADAGTVGLAGGIGLLAIFFIAYYCGGYVAGRMARFNGARQGLAVWLWAIVAALVIAVLVAIGADEYNILIELNNFPRVPVDEGDLTTTGVVVAVAVALSSLIGAVLGGMAGMRFHRKVDRAGLG